MAAISELHSEVPRRRRNPRRDPDQMSPRVGDLAGPTSRQVHNAIIAEHTKVEAQTATDMATKYLEAHPADSDFAEELDSLIFILTMDDPDTMPTPPAAEPMLRAAPPSAFDGALAPRQ